jgi:hypothetical protein
MWYNEYHSIINAGINPDELTTFFFFDYGLNFPKAGLYTLETTLNGDSAKIHAFVRASIECWNYAFAHCTSPGTVNNSPPQAMMVDIVVVILYEHFTGSCLW